jgi:hypothetical protein
MKFFFIHLNEKVGGVEWGNGYEVSDIMARWVWRLDFRYPLKRWLTVRAGYLFTIWWMVHELWEYLERVGRIFENCCWRCPFGRFVISQNWLPTVMDAMVVQCVEKDWVSVVEVICLSLSRPETTFYWVLLFVNSGKPRNSALLIKNGEIAGCVNKGVAQPKKSQFLKWYLRVLHMPGTKTAVLICADLAGIFLCRSDK